MLENSEEKENALQLLDLINVLDTFKFGICYVKHGQETEDEILRNTGGSPRYQSVSIFIN